MRNSPTESLIIFIIVCSLLIVLLISFVTYIVYRYQQKQNAYYKDLQELKVAHENEMLQSQVEIQEQTFENISREIHDNIGQKLTLAKLHLNTMNLYDAGKASIQLNDSITMISEAINDLSDISRSMSSEIILNNGLIKALEFELVQLNKSGLFKIGLSIQGEPVFLDAQQELILFRIVQEAINNIIKHALATKIDIYLCYGQEKISLHISDNGKGFLYDADSKNGTGLANMKRRAAWLHGVCMINTEPGAGTKINIEIPIHENN